MAKIPSPPVQPSVRWKSPVQAGAKAVDCTGFWAQSAALPAKHRPATVPRVETFILIPLDSGTAGSGPSGIISS